MKIAALGIATVSALMSLTLATGQAKAVSFEDLSELTVQVAIAQPTNEAFAVTSPLSEDVVVLASSGQTDQASLSEHGEMKVSDRLKTSDVLVWVGGILLMLVLVLPHESRDRAIRVRIPDNRW